MERLDKILANARVGSRKDVRQLIRDGRVRVDGQIIKDAGVHCDPETQEFRLDGEILDTRKFIYLILNKPAGYLSATEDNWDPVVIDLLSQRHQAFEPFPVGRLDKDTTGLLLLTNDGTLNHQLISPRWHVNKVYVATLRDPASEEYHAPLATGVTLEDGYVCMPARMEILSEDHLTVQLTIQEGKFHQVKRMFEALGNEVEELTRIAFGPIELPQDLPRGEYRELTGDEITRLKASVTQKSQPLST